MARSRSLPLQASFESLRKQAKKLVSRFACGDPGALARIHAQLPAAMVPLSLRDAQLVLAREYGFAGWQELRDALLRRDGKSLEWAVAEAARSVHENNLERLAQLIRDYPELLAWRGDSGESLLGFATGSFGDSGDPYREQRYTRIECAEFLLDSGAVPAPAIWEDAIRARANGVLHLLSRKGFLPRRLDALASIGDAKGVVECLELAGARPDGGASEIAPAFLCACSFQHRAIASLLFDRYIGLDSTLGERVEKWFGRDAFIDYLSDHGQRYGDPWQSVVINEIFTAIDEGKLQEFTAWLNREPDLLEKSHLELQTRIVERAVLKNRGSFIARMLEFHPAIEVRRPPSSALVMAMDYGNAHLIPLLTSIWPLPDDLCHAAGSWDFARVKRWFDELGRPVLGDLGQHYPANDPYVLRNLQWTPPGTQHILDVALAWSCVNHHFEIAKFLLERGANIDTNWGTHERSSVLHECAIHGNYEAAQFLIDHGIDMTIRDYRWNATAEGWARYAAKDEKMADLLARAHDARKGISL